MGGVIYEYVIFSVGLYEQKPREFVLVAFFVFKNPKKEVYGVWR